MTLKGGTTQACAACKYQRKRCTPECPLAPHFRPEHTEIFKNAHKLFGVKNILKVLDQIDPSQKTEAMRSMIYQANMRDRFPVHGCYGIVIQLQIQIRQTEKELYAVLSQLEFYKNQRPQHEIVLSPLDSPESQRLQLGMGVEQPDSAAPTTAALTLFQHQGVGGGDSHHQHQQPQQQPFVLASGLPIPPYSGNGNGHDGYNNNNSGIHMDLKENMIFVWGQQTYCNENENKNDDGGKGVVSTLQSELVNSTQQLTIQDEVTHDYDEIYPFFDTIDDTQSYMDSKEANDSSPESSPKETTQSLKHVAGSNLRSAELQLGIMSQEYQAIA
ncbi:unnamed protein product [Lactuca saligna]|uniref:LOB domain-containing protein n=1 Tax=Lactuca saligna TaxID=75948 RepID=A0AA35YAC4_LACSI|nr:unnamed protein product [Lactuca saligna]